MARVVHFELPADKPERASAFYTKVFNWKIEKSPDMDYWLISTGDKQTPGIDGAIMPRDQEKCVIGTIDVPSVDEFIERIKSSGGDILLPKTAIPGVGYFAYFKDTEGNKMGIFQDDVSAK